MMPQLPPGPKGFPILGYLPYLGSDLHQNFMELAQVYGPIYKLSIGRKQCVIISSPSLAKEVLRDQDITFANRNPSIASLAFSFGGNDIAFASYGPQWRLLRKIFVREMLSNENLDAFYPLRRNELKKSVRDVYSKVDTPVNISELAFLTVINMITSMFWGGSLDDNEDDETCTLRAEFRAAVSQLVSLLGKPNISDFFPFLAWMDVQRVERNMKKVSRWLEQIFEFVIAQKRNSCEVISSNKDFLQVLLDFKDPDTGRSISTTEMKAMLMDIVIGGTDTTSTMVEWTMTELVKHPESLRKCQEELSEVVGNENNVEESHLANLIYLHAAVKETLRLHPAAPLLLPRSPTKSSIVGGYVIPKGTKVFVNAWAIHRDPQFWASPTEFRPERFLDESKLDYHGNNLHYIPFGAGRSICAGLPLGEKMLMQLLAMLLHLFEWKLPSGAKIDSREKLGVVLEKSTPLVLVPKPRLPNINIYN
ncbi:flavonoid 3'-monooxygenase-like [Humulus lupulus]|uniref:flavonoid 3'-monooxygenase-like n=1 Tax=Humulus lupulus TaxID=3486 RepID=UPI002B40072E|nr:flavonoid 3'-monooxygenase-like [Humulus lupulus]